MLPRRLSLGLAALLVAASGCVPPVPSNDEVLEYDPVLTAMGRIQEAGVLRIGIPAHGGPFAAGTDDGATGFLVEVGNEVAASLGVEAEFRSGTDEELGSLIDSGTIDLAFPLRPITEKAISEHSFSDPYWIAHERVLAFTSDLAEVADLTGRSVCLSLDDITGIPLERLGAEPGNEIEVDTLEDCPEVDAMVAPDIRLLAQMSPGKVLPALVGEEINAVGYGAMTSPEDKTLADYVSTQLSEVKNEGRWSAWYADFIAPYTGEDDPEVPGMYLEEAAALYPLGG